ncbi:MAG: CRISPR-associated endonuclease Cas2 [Candidatus Saccharimonadales bacterium]
MAKNAQTSALVDAILRMAVMGTALSAIVLAPNALIGLDKPMRRALGALDRREREREIARVLTYMRSQKLLAENYENGLEITTLGRLRLKRMEYEKLTIPVPEVWDGQWRLVLFDIPEDHKRVRRLFTDKLKQLGYKYLQQSVWVHPFESRPEITLVCEKLDISRFVTYIITAHIDHEAALIERFKQAFTPDK